MLRCMGCMEEYQDGLPQCPHCGYQRGTSAREAYHLPPETILGGRYIVGRVLGFGGFGVTYIGYDAQLGRVVAIKEFLPTTFATRMPGYSAITVYEGAATQQFSFGLERFIEEAQRLAQFNGIPGITDIYDTFASNNTAYIVMEYLNGQDVKERLAANGPLPYEEARDIILKVCDTLAPVHAQGIIHRDLSPDNIFITKQGEIKLLDFGAARYESSVNSKSLSVILKAGYAPEEQYRSRGDQGPWTDVYALAATFYKILTGVTPPDSMERAIKDEIKEPSKMDIPIPKSAENALMNSLNIRKADRTKSVEEFKTALLADGVERVKVKPRRADTGKIPLWVKILLAGCGLCLIVLATLSGTGVIELAPNLLEDNFGSPLQEGNVIVPSLAGKTQAEAEKILKENGLKMETGPYMFSDSLDKGVVLSQEPLSGRQVAEGGTVTISFSAGSLEGAMADGTIPNLVGMDVVQGTGLLHNLPGNFYYNCNYEYSDTVPVGQVTRFTRAAGESHLEVFISAGSQGSPTTYGTPVAPFLDAGYDIRSRIALTNLPPYEDDLDNSTEWEYSISTDGSNWMKIGSNYAQSSVHENDIAENRVPNDNFDLMNLFNKNFSLVANQTFQIQISRYARGSSNEGDGLLSSFVFPQTVTLNSSESSIVVDSVETLGWDEFDKLIQDGTISQGDNILSEYERMDESQKEFSYPARLKGNFTNNKQYRLQFADDSYASHVSNIRNGEIYFIYTNHNTNEIPKFYIWSNGDTTISEDGTQITINTEAPFETYINPSNTDVDVTGLSPDEAAEKLKSISEEGFALFTTYIHSNQQPAGRVISWNGDRYGNEKYVNFVLFVSTGPDTGQPVIVQGNSYYGGDGMYAPHNMGFYWGNAPTVTISASYSGDGGVTWEEYDSGVFEPSSITRDEDRFGESRLSPGSEVTVPNALGRVQLLDYDTGEQLAVYEYALPLSENGVLEY